MYSGRGVGAAGHVTCWLPCVYLPLNEAVSAPFGCPVLFSCHFALLYWKALPRPFGACATKARGPHGSLVCKPNTALSGGSLGTCVDEERSQLRELV